MKVLKFGGSSVGSAENIEKVIEIIKNASRADSCAVVLSAMSGTTDALINIAKTAESSDENFRVKIKELETKHLDTARKLFGENSQDGIFDFIENRFNELKNICEGVFLLRELSLRTLDRIVSFGEILSTKIVAAKFNSLGIENVWKDSRQLIKTDSNFGNAAVEFEKTNQLIKDFFDQILATRNSQPATIFILQGFIASDSENVTTTLGRGGSDYTGAILSAALNAEVLEIWTDVSGMMTADPRIVREYRQIAHITYREAMELSHFGAKVIYPPTIQPVLQKNIPIFIKNTFAPEDYGTFIEAESTNEKEIIRGITSIDKIAILSLEGSGMVGIPGFSKRLFDALSRAQINVILITQSSSEHSICVGIEEKFSDTAKRVVDAEFENEIAVGKIEPLQIERNLSILALVGDNMRHHTGISGKMFAALGAQGVNIRAIAQGSSERNISAVIESEDVRKAVNTLHEEFFSDGKRQLNLYIAGVGTVGKKLLNQLAQQTEYLSENLRLNIRVVGLANSKKILFNDEGIDLKNFKSEISDSKIDSNAKNLADLIVEKNLRNSIFVDVTASVGNGRNLFKAFAEINFRHRLQQNRRVGRI